MYEYHKFNNNNNNIVHNGYKNNFTCLFQSIFNTSILCKFNYRVTLIIIFI